ncbi:type II toxin-antitoxin system MqsR family toxin [Herbaspirillum sp. CAH-3]|jgi:motility quorum-sensing regulator/GCU-specific mRNA interferase toxin|uniref:type II toxin-antitoxin system MqsR family toxin n=1 Tax=Herbaspirillum sp. CAH-3 TaxID=2605746 RepID=UPI0012AD1FD3|nr:type II toxin-antitoxin system MqsR family toxin [Herbaspirillum sp. CAH-3]MRT28741.1 mRNA interferase MqsR [Herbaspirillum sp. CAH-3]
MEKNSPHCPLSTVRDLIRQQRVAATHTAKAGAAALGLGFIEMLEVVMALTEGDFHKAMTTHADDKVWQDVYKPMTHVGQLYVKLTVVNSLLIVSFKEK